MILSNQAKCLKCNDIIYSAHRHDYVKCGCGAIAVDGGMDYLRRSYKNLSDIEEMSIVVSDTMFKNCIEQLEWCEDTGRNNLGIMCAIARAIRDSGYEITKRK